MNDRSRQVASGRVGGSTNVVSGWLNSRATACIAASCSYAVGAIVTRLAPPGPYLAFAAGGLLVAAALILTPALALEGLPVDFTTRNLRAVSALTLTDLDAAYARVATGEWTVVPVGAGEDTVTT